MKVRFTSWVLKAMRPKEEGMTKYKQIVSRLFYTVLLAAAWLQTGPSFAQSGPQPWQMDFRPSATPVMDDIIDFHNLLLVIEVLIVLFVLGLMVYICVKFNAKANPVPSKTTHNVFLEVVWTVIPIIILIVITVPSVKLLVFMDKAPKEKVEMTLKVIGHQWYWSYEYPELGEDFTFDAFMLAEDELEEGQLRLLETDESVVVPVDTNIRLLVTADDVLHAWTIPSFGIKIDAVPGRINEGWFRVDAEGIYYGQCSELCGREHAFMPIRVKAVSKEAYAEWVVYAKEEFASNDSDEDLSVARLASAD